MTANAEALLEQHYDVHHRGRESLAPTGSSSSSNRWRRRDTDRAEAEPVKELTDTAVHGEEGVPDDFDGEQDEPEDDEIRETDLAALLGNSGEDPEADGALAEALQLDAVAMVAWQRFSGKGKGKNKGKGKAKGKGKNKGSNLSLEERKKRLAELKSRTNCQACGACGHWAGGDICPKNAKSDGWPQPLARGIWLSEVKHLVSTSPCSAAIRLQMPQPWSHASMPATSRCRHRRRHRQVRDDRGNHRVSFPHRLHRHLSALEGVKSTAVEARTPQLNVSLVWTAVRHPPV